MKKAELTASERNKDIVAAIRAGGESYEQIGERYQLGGERIRQIGVDAGVKLAPAPRVRRCWCGRELRQETNGAGGVVDVCERHGSNITGGVAVAHTDRINCKVDGCPGYLDGQGNCACCIARATWAQANLPAHKCKICRGDIPKGHYCAPCRSLSHRAQKAARATA